MRIHHKLLTALLVALTCNLTIQAQVRTLQPEDARDLARLTASGLDNALTVQEAYTMAQKATPDPLSELKLWHALSLVVTALDHSPVLGSSPAAYHEQYGPPRTSRALALVHLAMFEAANGYEDSHEHKYAGLLLHLKTPKGETGQTQWMQSAAIVEAAYGTLAWLYPGLTTTGLPDSDGVGLGDCEAHLGTPQAGSLRRFYHCSMGKIQAAAGANPDCIHSGLEFGREVVGEIVSERANDGSSLPEPSWGVDFTPTDIPHKDGNYTWLQWQKDPVSGLNIALGGRWAAVKPFTLHAANEFRVEDWNSAIARFHLGYVPPSEWPSYHAVRTYGGEARLNTPPNAPIPAMPNYQDLYYVAKFWAYDGTAGLCAPVREYNQIADAALSKTKLKNTTDIARYYALLNLAMADAAIASWDSKYYFQAARPVTAIRGEDAKDPANKLLWFPLGAQNTNSAQPYNITPAFPAYPSGHAVFGGAFFGVLRQYWREAGYSNTETFRFQSDEYNGKNKDVYNYVRCSGDGNPLHDNDPRFCNNTETPDGKGRTLTLDCAERENADSRVWMGVHWMFDADDGILLGNQVAHAVYTRALAPLAHKADPNLDTFMERTSGRSRNEALDHTPFTLDERVKLVCADLGVVHKDVLGDITDSYAQNAAAVAKMAASNKMKAEK